ncbi:MAG: hypothetical protein MI922_03915 [Bacteroidales bacterium]|nr:hypothetical protein [Bacteroidales bacterium]
MNLGSEHIQNLYGVALIAASKAGEFIAENTTSNYDINKKEAGNSLASQVVTEIDIQSQKIILDHLEKSVMEYDLGVLAEETTDNNSRFEKDYFWCIDPLDGTLPFTEGVPGYAVSIALVTKLGTSVIGVVYDPYNKQIYSAYHGGGAFLNGKKLNFLKNKNQKVFTWVMDRSFASQSNYNSIKKELNNHIAQLGFEELRLIQSGGAAMNAMWVLENNPGCYFKIPKSQKGGGSIWDFAATSCIFKETNTHVSDAFGEEINLNQVESTFLNKTGVLFASHENYVPYLTSLIKRYLDE